MNIPVIICPHCGDYVEILQINCGIFRHGALKSNNQQIPPHSSKEFCDQMIKNKLIYGCGKPFKLIKIDNDFYHAEKCDYI